jgi:TPR repeat protein
MYQNGQGVPQDNKTAVKWYRLAAKQGDAEGSQTGRAIHPHVSNSKFFLIGIPLTDIPCQTSRMRNLTATLCLTIAVLVGVTGVSWSADFQKGVTAVKSGDFATDLR